MPTSKSKSKWLGITLGDPSGIGAEITAKALRDPSVAKLANYKLIGDGVIFRKFGLKETARCRLIDLKNFSSFNKIKQGVDRRNGLAAWSYLKKAVQLLKSGQIQALVTAPVSKEAIALSHPHFLGHTEFLAQHFCAKGVEMMFVHKSLHVVLVTRHIPIKKVPRAITPQKVLATIELADKTLKNLFNIKRPRIAVSGLNPHAGESGLLGQEERTSIIPAVKKARLKKIRAWGPFAADTLFTSVNRKKYDAFIAMYHDQGLTPAKTLFFDTLVNVSIGLPFIRTSPDHGTAFDIAGKNRADPSSMKEAIKLAVRLSR
ncbi:MAG TPA: 4-hydroxythreonine-4-phosphate dehydrogenase PdxA [Candidatus Omnitrophota bacterium]|nr:4-hydroxythreonine-4-phosphate dehydrogenase PdxA [Candidatus Omnitrophota bacterium]